MSRLKKLGARVATFDARAVKLPPKTVDPHYNSPEHARWRAAVIKRAGGLCERCRRRGCRLFADHIVERRDGGDACDVANGQALCGACHTAKTAQARLARARGVGV